MPRRAKLYIFSTIAIGVALLAGCLVFDWDFSGPSKYSSYLLLACLGSTLKIKLPKIQGTMSTNFLFVLIGIGDLTLVQTTVLGCFAALVQCLWRPRKQPLVIQVLFNISALAMSIAGSFSVSRALVQPANLPVLLAIAVCSYFLTNTGMISLVLSLVEDQPFAKAWRQCYLWSFPYYLVGAAVAGTITFSSRRFGWKPSLLMLPMMYLIYSYYRLYLDHQNEPEPTRA